MCHLRQTRISQHSEVEEQFQDLTTQINLYQKTHKVIVLGDFNAKVEMNVTNDPRCHQKTSRNGKMLDNLIKNTNTTIVNTLSTHQGTWTRVNRRNNNEKSIIDYIIVSKSMADKIIESKTDDGEEYLIMGTNPTDHNVITITIDTKIQRNQEKTRKWKTGTKEQWKNFNRMIRDQWEKEHQSNKNINTLQESITEFMEKSIGSKIVNNNRKIKICNPQIKAAKEQRKQHKYKFTQACNNNDTNKHQLKCIYIESQKTVRHLIEKQHRESIKQTADKLIREGGANSNTFWKTRKRIMNHNNQDDYDTIDENGNPIKDPDTAKEHIADYFENLYQAREGEESYEQWTNHINDTVNNISNSNEKSQNENPISREELNTCIKKLKRNKSNGPDRIPNEVFIEADEHTKGIYLETLNTIYTVPDRGGRISLYGLVSAAAIVECHGSCK